MNILKNLTEIVYLYPTFCSAISYDLVFYLRDSLTPYKYESVKLTYFGFIPFMNAKVEQ